MSRGGCCSFFSSVSSWIPFFIFCLFSFLLVVLLFALLRGGGGVQGDVYGSDYPGDLACSNALPTSAGRLRTDVFAGFSQFFFVVLGSFSVVLVVFCFVLLCCVLFRLMMWLFYFLLCGVMVVRCILRSCCFISAAVGFLLPFRQFPARPCFFSVVVAFSGQRSSFSSRRFCLVIVPVPLLVDFLALFCLLAFDCCSRFPGVSPCLPSDSSLRLVWCSASCFVLSECGVLLFVFLIVVLVESFVLMSPSLTSPFNSFLLYVLPFLRSSYVLDERFFCFSRFGCPFHLRCGRERRQRPLWLRRSENDAVHPLRC